MREGLVLRWYKDSLGKLTGGYGHLQLPGEDGIVITQRIADDWLEGDISAATKAATQQAAKLPFCSPELEAVLVSVNFQLGSGWIKKFPKTWALMTQGKFSEAAYEVEDSLWEKQTPIRVLDLQRALWRNELLWELYLL